MTKINVAQILPLLLAGALASCGGGGSTSPTVTASTSTQAQAQVQGYWAPANPANEAYEFYASPDVAPYTALKTGRVMRGGESLGLFYWNSNADGSIKVSKIDTACDKRPIDQCPVSSIAT